MKTINKTNLAVISLAATLSSTANAQDNLYVNNHDSIILAGQLSTEYRETMRKVTKAANDMSARYLSQIGAPNNDGCPQRPQISLPLLTDESGTPLSLEAQIVEETKYQMGLDQLDHSYIIQPECKPISCEIDKRYGHIFTLARENIAAYELLLNPQNEHQQIFIDAGGMLGYQQDLDRMKVALGSLDLARELYGPRGCD